MSFLGANPLPNRIRLKPRFVNILRDTLGAGIPHPWPNMGIPVPRPDTPKARPFVAYPIAATYKYTSKPPHCSHPFKSEAAPRFATIDSNRLTTALSCLEATVSE